MHYLISADTDIGLRKNTNQDSLMIKRFETHIGETVFVVLCDGMGGFDKGEVASATVIDAFEKWALENMKYVSEQENYQYILRQQWTDLITGLNEKIMNYGRSQGIKLGTTAVIMLITKKKYYLMNVGDSRAYEIENGFVNQLTKDQTFVMREVEQGRMTMEQAMTDPRRSVLLQCVGASEHVYPDMFFGDTKQDASYMLCSDGFRHEITSEEIYQMLAPEQLSDEQNIKNNIRNLIDLNMERNEMDNITAAVIKMVV